MRSFFTALAVLALLVGSAAAGKVEVKGPHICCQQCSNVVAKILAKVDGVADVSSDRTTKTVVFTAKDDAAAKAGLKALIDGGFFGSATVDGKDLPTGVAEPAKGTKADVVVVKDVHVCCGACQKAINALFTDAKVTYEGKGPQRAVNIAGKDLDSGVVLEALRKAGFNGAPAK
jgi:copper chaperone CopZ